MKKIKAISGMGIEVPPQLTHVKIYFGQKNLDETEAELFYAHYDHFNWKQGNGSPVKNWKVEANDWIWTRNSLRQFIARALSKEHKIFKGRKTG